MRILSLLITLAAFAAGVMFMVSRYERYQQNNRIEAQNLRKSDANKVVKAINAMDRHSRSCTDYMIGLTTGTFEQEATTANVALFFGETCGKCMTTEATKATDVIAGLANEDDGVAGRTKFLSEARALVETYRSQASDFEAAYQLLKAAGSQSARAALNPQVTPMMNRAIPAINRGLDGLESARRAYIYPNG